MFIVQVIESLVRHKVPYALVGGVAVSLHGKVRFTSDVDIVLNFKKDDFLRAERALLAIGLKPRLPVNAADVFNYREDYI